MTGCGSGPAAVAAPPGGQGRATVSAKPRRWNWFGAPRPHPFQVAVEADGMAGATDAVMEQRRIGWWPIVGLLLVVLPVAVLAM